MRRIFRSKASGLVVIATGFALGSMMVGGVFAQSNPTPPPTFNSREQNLDTNGLIRVHEQGVLKANVQVDNFPQSISVDNLPTSISVNNFPKTQDVNVIGGNVFAHLPPVTIGFSETFSAGPGETATFVLPAPINATTITVSKGDSEGAIYFKSSVTLAGGAFRSIKSVFHIDDQAGKVPFVDHSFTRPVPIDAIVISCTNEQFLCAFSVDIVGDPGA